MKRHRAGPPPVPLTAIRSTIANVALASGSFLITLLLLEVLVRSFTAFPIHSPLSNRVIDERLLYRMDRNVVGIDREGFRNSSSNGGKHPPIATIGDSHTYGVNVSRQMSWPGRIESLLGSDVYNFGIGSYNLLQYVETLRMAVDRGARVILIGLYGQNDLRFCDVARLSYWQETFFTSDERRSRLQGYCDYPAGQVNNTPKQILAPYNPGKFRLANHSALYSFLRYLADYWVPRRDNLSRVFLQHRRSKGNDIDRCADPENDFIFETDRYRDFIPSRFRYYRNYRDDIWSKKADIEPLVLSLFREMRLTAERRGSRILITMIPTRLAVTHGYLSREGVEVPGWVAEAAQAEAEITHFLMETATREGIAVVNSAANVTTAYGVAVEAGEIFYPCKDTHPLEAGYQSYADAMTTQARRFVGTTFPQ